VGALDKLSIDTPEQVALDFALASIGSRFLALAVDTLIQTAATIALVALGLGLLSLVSVNLQAAGPWLLAALFLAYFLIYNAYFAVFEALWNGQTPGKRVIGLRVISTTGRPISVFEAILRNVVRIADQLPGIYAIGIVSIFVTERNQRLGDLAAGTVVVHQPGAAEAARRIPDAPPLAPPVALDLDEQRAVLELAERSATLTRERFEELAELPKPLVGPLTGERAAARLVGMANYLSGRQ
jgi:uncharacterized RDD family membrane protein YckC